LAKKAMDKKMKMKSGRRSTIDDDGSDLVEMPVAGRRGRGGALALARSREDEGEEGGRRRGPLALLGDSSEEEDEDNDDDDGDSDDMAGHDARTTHGGALIGLRLAREIS